MSGELVTALIAFAGTLIGTLGGILASNKLVMFRIEQLEKKVDKHNHLIERMAIVERDVKSAHRRLDEVVHDMEKE